MATLVMLPSAVANFRDIPWAWVVVVLNVLAIANIPRAIYLGKPGYAFISSRAPNRCAATPTARVPSGASGASTVV